MDEKNINISKSEEELLEIMENRSHITTDQLHNLKEDEECLQAYSDLAEIVIAQGRDIQSCFIRRNRSLLEFRQPISLPYDF